MAKKAHARLRDSHRATGLGDSTGESKHTCQSLDAQERMSGMAHHPEQSDERYAWNEESHAQP